MCARYLLFAARRVAFGVAGIGLVTLAILFGWCANGWIVKNGEFDISFFGPIILVSLAAAFCLTKMTEEYNKG